MAVPAIPDAGKPWLTWAQGVDAEARKVADKVSVADIADPNSTGGAALRAAFVPALPTAGSYTYNADGTIKTDPDGNAYTWNADGTPATQTKGGVTRTFNWNADLTLASVT